jgi:flagellar capping protein FliD
VTRLEDEREPRLVRGPLRRHGRLQASRDEPNTEGYQDSTVDSGLADVLWRVIDRITSSQEGPIVDQNTGERRPLEGIFTARENLLRSNIRRYDDQIEAKERRLDQFEENLIKRFASLERLMGELNARGAALTNALSGLPSA